MRPIQVTILLLFISATTFCQANPGDSLRAAHAELHASGKFRLIPNNVLNGLFDFLVIPPDYSSVPVMVKDVINISWQSPYIDGTYALVITPKQIYFRSGHDNPNPNYLYWMASIDTTQYALIRNHLESGHQKHHIKAGWTSPNSYHRYYIYRKAKKEKYVHGTWENKRYENLARLLDLFNRVLRASDNQISVPDYHVFLEIQPVRIVFSLEDLEW